MAVESLEKDARLGLKDDSTVAPADHLKLLRELLSILVPECLDFVVKHPEVLEKNASKCDFIPVSLSSLVVLCHCIA